MNAGEEPEPTIEPATDHINNETTTTTAAAAAATTTTTTTTSTTSTTTTSTGRSLRKRSNPTLTQPPNQKKAKKLRVEQLQSTDIQNVTSHDKQMDNPMERARHLITSWICAECKEAECITNPDSPLLVCEGPCLRLFHYPCARLSSLPPSDQPWICEDCKHQRHKCVACQEYGRDYVQVYKCEKKTCGLFYHEQCLTMYDLVITSHRLEQQDKTSSNLMSSGEEQLNHFPWKRQDDDEEEEDALIGGDMLKFKCPAHYCWTCSGGVVPLEDTETNGNHIIKKEDENGHVSDHLVGNNGPNHTSKDTTRMIAKQKLKLSGCFNEKSGDLIVRCC